jgi:hypothetical protein
MATVVCMEGAYFTVANVSFAPRNAPRPILPIDSLQVEAL